MNLLQAMAPADAARALVLCGAAAMTWSAVLGFVMLVPMQPWGKGLFPAFNAKQVGAAHLDWIVLALMLGLAAGVIVACGLSPSTTVVVALAAGAWLNPLPYVFRAFGINAFVLSGPLHQRLAAGLGLLSSLLILYGWGTLLLLAFRGTA